MDGNGQEHASPALLHMANKHGLQRNEERGNWTSRKTEVITEEQGKKPEYNESMLSL